MTNCICRTLVFIICTKLFKESQLMEHAVSADGLHIFHVLALTIHFQERAANLPNSDVNFLRSLTNKLSSLMEGYSKSWRYVLDPYVPCAVALVAFTYCDNEIGPVIIV